MQEDKVKDEPVKHEELVESPPGEKKSFFSVGKNNAPLPHILDLRSLALFRIFFGILQLSDIYERLKNGKYDLAFYTSYPPER